MKASTVILVLLGAGLFYLLWKGRLPLIGAPASVTRNNTGGSQPVVPKDDFATAADDVSNIFANATKLFGGGNAQTNPVSL